MRLPLILAWLLLPVLVGAYHYGPGQERLKLDQASTSLRQAQQAFEDERWTSAIDKFDEALAQLPEERVNDARRIRLEKAKARMMAQQLPTAHDELRTVLDEMLKEETTDPKLLRDVRDAFANSQYYMTWLMRLEGLKREAWEPEIEAARQTYRLLAEKAEADGDVTAAKKSKEDLESAIRLARMDLTELQGLPLPGQCKGCCSSNSSCRSRSKSQKKGESDARGASSGPPPDGAGS